MSNGLLYIAGLIAIALAALFAGPYFVDWNGYRGVFEEEASRILGREVRVGGNVNVRLLPEPFVRFDKLRIADPTGNTGEPFFSAESFTMKLSVPPLLKGVLEAKEIELKHPVLRLALDADGGGNWRSLSITPGTLPFVPAGVSLQSVIIEDGHVALYGPKGVGFAQLEGLNGEFTADFIEGPFSFKGQVKWQGAERELRLSTAPPDAEGSVHFKTTLRCANHNDIYVVDGRLFDFKQSPRIEGDVTAKLELDPAQLPNAPTPDNSTLVRKAEKPMLDFKAKLAGDAKGLRLDDITLSFERVGQPQLITGSATARWSDALGIDLNLASRWLDLDRIASAEAAQSPLAITRGIVSTAMEALPAAADTKVRFDLDQASLGGESVSGIRLEVVRSNGVLVLKDLRADLPGGSKVALDGAVADVKKAKAFLGEFTLRGTSLRRFLTWANKDQQVADAVRSDGPFSLHGRLGLTEKSIDLVDAGAEIGGTPLTGEVHYSTGKRTRLAVALKGHEIDASPLWPAGVGYLQDLLLGPALGATKDGDAARTEGPRWLDLSTSDVKLQLNAGRLVTGRQTLRDVDMDVAVEQGKLTMRALRFATRDGLGFQFEGDVADVSGQPRGALRWILSAPTTDAFSAFIGLLDLAGEEKAEAMRLASLVPMRLAGTIDLGERNKSAADIAVDGSVQGGRLVATAHLDAGLRNWRQSGVDLALTIECPDIVRMLASLGAGAQKAPTAAQPRAGEIYLRAVGTPADGLLSSASARAPGLSLAYDGSIKFPEKSSSQLDGEVRVASRELSDVMTFAGLGGGGLQGVAIQGQLKVITTEHAIELEPRQLTIGGSKIDGRLALAHPDDGPAIVTAQLAIDQASIPGLLAVALDRSVTADTATEPLTEGKTIWPEHPFDFSALTGVEGKLGVDFGTLSLVQGMEIKKARLEVTLAPGKVSVTKLQGRALGGEVIAVFDLEQAAGGASLVGNVRLTGAHLTASGAAAPAQDATASLALEFSGRASTPGALLTVATGKGELSLGETKMHAPTPFAVVATAEAVLTGQAGSSGEALTRALREQFGASDVKVGPRKIAIEIADGAAKFAPFTLQSDAGRTAVETTVDLASLMIDSAWLLEPKGPDVAQTDRPRKGALPSVNVVYVGPLKDVWTLEPRITAAPLERELAIRKMELDAEQLERLHKLDAERARQEEERRKALEEAERARAAERLASPPDDPIEPPAPQPATPNFDAPQALSGTGVSGPATNIPPVTGEEALVVPPGAVDPVTGEPLPEVSGEAVESAPQKTYRRRRAVRRNIPAGDQVLRSLQNNAN